VDPRIEHCSPKSPMRRSDPQNSPGCANKTPDFGEDSGRLALGARVVEFKRCDSEADEGCARLRVLPTRDVWGEMGKRRRAPQSKAAAAARDSHLSDHSREPVRQSALRRVLGSGLLQCPRTQPTRGPQGRFGLRRSAPLSVARRHG